MDLHRKLAKQRAEKRGAILRVKDPETPVYLDVENVKPGDLLFSYGGGSKRARKAELAITSFTRGPFSHVAIFITPMLLLEALRDGIGITPLPLGQVAMPSKGRHALKWINCVKLPPGARYALLRHESFDVDSVSERAEIADELLEASYSLHGKRYPRLPKLLGTVMPGVFLKPFKSVLMRRKELEGLFCSELCAFLARALEVRLFDGDRLPVSVSPNRLWRSRYLSVVPQALFSTDAEFEEHPTPDFLRTSRELRLQRDRLLKETSLKVKRDIQKWDAFMKKTRERN